MEKSDQPVQVVDDNNLMGIMLFLFLLTRIYWILNQDSIC